MSDADSHTSWKVRYYVPGSSTSTFITWKSLACAAMGFLFAVALYDTKSGPSKSFNTFSNLKPMKITFGNWIEKSLENVTITTS